VRAGFLGEEEPVAVLFGLLAGAVRLVDEGVASRTDVDTAVRLGLGWPAGPLELVEEIGPAATLGILTALHERTGRRAYAPPPLLRRVVAAGLPGVPDGPGTAVGSAVPARGVQCVGVVGTGTMATGIAACTAAAGLPTVIVGRTRDRAAAARDRTGSELVAAAEMAALDGCDVVVEAVVEDLAVKREVFAALDDACRPGAVLATTTSSLAVIDCAAATTRPQDVIGLHFFNPAVSMPLVELVGTLRSAPNTMATGHELVRRLGKTAVECPDRAGFVVNRLLFPFLCNALATAGRGAIEPAALDRALRGGLGIPMGPMRLLDVIGLDVVLAGQEGLLREFGDPELAPPALLTELVAEGVLGVKSGHSIVRHLNRRSDPCPLAQLSSTSTRP
jgi:3-hydroxybutyryl-CoA dehydrogenase